MTVPCILTYTGKWFPFLNPTTTDYDIDDIARALSHACRFAGQTRKFYSVAEHCVHVSRQFKGELALYGLLHDLSEAYIADLSRPVKRCLAGYQEIEQRIQERGQEAFGLKPYIPSEIKEVDNRILIDERDQLMPKDGVSGDWPDFPPLGIELQCWRPDVAMYLFLTEFDNLRSEL